MGACPGHLLLRASQAFLVSGLSGRWPRTRTPTQSKTTVHQTSLTMQAGPYLLWQVGEQG